MGKGVGVAEGQERLEDELHGSRRLEEFILYKDLVTVLGEKDALAEKHLSDLVGDLRHRIRAEVHYVLVSARLIDVSIAMNSEVELLTLDYEALIQIREQKISVPSETVQGDGQKTVITPRIAGQNRRVAIRTGLIGAQNLPL